MNQTCALLTINNVSACTTLDRKPHCSYQKPPTAHKYIKTVFIYIYSMNKTVFLISKQYSESCYEAILHYIQRII